MELVRRAWEGGAIVVKAQQRLEVSADTPFEILLRGASSQLCAGQSVKIEFTTSAGTLSTLIAETTKGTRKTEASEGAPQGGVVGNLVERGDCASKAGPMATGGCLAAPESQQKQKDKSGDDTTDASGKGATESGPKGSSGDPVQAVRPKGAGP